MGFTIFVGGAGNDFSALERDVCRLAATGNYQAYAFIL